MNRERALRTLGLEKGAQPADINRAYRELIRHAHPDVGGTTAVAARITEAYHWLRRAGNKPPEPSKSSPQKSAMPAKSKTDDSLVLHLPAGDVFARLVDAGHELGEVSYIDPTTGIVQVTFTADNGVVCQLAATVQANPVSGTRQRETQVEFTLDPLASGQAPPIGQVVAQLVRLINSRSI